MIYLSLIPSAPNPYHTLPAYGHQMGWCADTKGKQLVHADMKFDPNASPQCYRSNDELIQKDTKVRLQLVGCRMEQNEIVRLPMVPLARRYTRGRD